MTWSCFCEIAVLNSYITNVLPPVNDRGGLLWLIGTCRETDYITAERFRKPMGNGYSFRLMIYQFTSLSSNVPSSVAVMVSYRPWTQGHEDHVGGCACMLHTCLDMLRSLALGVKCWALCSIILDFNLPPYKTPGWTIRCYWTSCIYSATDITLSEQFCITCRIELNWFVTFCTGQELPIGAKSNNILASEWNVMSFAWAPSSRSWPWSKNFPVL